MQNRGLLIAGGIGCLALVVCGGLAAAVGGLALLGGGTAGSGSVENIQVGLIAPHTARVGENFSILVRVTNTAVEPQFLDSIDIQKSYTDGIVIGASNPAYSDTFEFVGWQSYTYQRSIAPGGEILIQYQATAVLEGDHSGILDVCTTVTDCLSTQIRTVVSP